MMAPRCTVFLFIMAATVFTQAASGAFEGYKLVSVLAHSIKDVEFLRLLSILHAELDFWQGPYLDRSSTMLLTPSLVPVVQSALTKHGIAWREMDVVVSRIVQAGMERSKMHASPPGRMNGVGVDHSNYHGYDEIVSYLHQFETSYPDNAHVSFLPYFTHEGRQVTMIHLKGTTASTSSTTKPSILMESGIHAREWISPAATLYFIQQVLERYDSNDPTARKMLDEYDWYVVPVTNPDGYEYTRKSPETRFWRKNRRMMPWQCSGVDLNRNFDIYFGSTGVSQNCSSLIYPGPRSFSEPETANVRELFGTIQDSVVAYLSVHSYSQFLLVPWSWSDKALVPDNIKELERVASSMSKAINDTHGKFYEVGTAHSLLNYAASGGSKDWAIYKKPGIFAVTYELRPDSEDERGFNLPPDEIVPTGQEFVASLEAMVNALKT